MSKQCPRCLSDNTEEHHAVTTFTYRERDITLPCDEYYTHCNNCGYEFVTPKQSKQWDKSADDARHKADSLLVPDEIKELAN